MHCNACKELREIRKRPNFFKIKLFDIKFQILFVKMQFYSGYMYVYVNRLSNHKTKIVDLLDIIC